jgi:hypothetical protein
MLKYMEIVKTMMPAPSALPLPAQPSYIPQILTALAPIIAPLLTRLVAPPPPPPSQAQSLTEIMGALNAMRAFVQPADESGGDLASIIQPVASIVEKLIPPAGMQPRPAPMPPAPSAIAPSAPIIPAHPRPAPMPAPSAMPAPPSAPIPNPGISDEAFMVEAQRRLASLGGAQLTELYLASLDQLGDNDHDLAMRTLNSALLVDEFEEDDNSRAVPIDANSGAGRTDGPDPNNA